MSKTDHGRKPGSHTVMSRFDRRSIDYDQYPTMNALFGGSKRPVILAVTEIHDVLKTDEVTPPRLCKFCRSALVEPVDWERELLKEFNPETDEWVDSAVWDYCDYSCMGDHDSFINDGLEWRVSDDTLDYHDREMAREAFLDDEEGWEFHDEAWLPLMSIAEAREAFGGTDFTIQHTNVLRRTR